MYKNYLIGVNFKPTLKEVIIEGVPYDLTGTKPKMIVEYVTNETYKSDKWYDNSINHIYDILAGTNYSEIESIDF